MEIPTILVGKIIRIFPREEIKIRPNARINIDPRGMHMGINNRPTGATNNQQGNMSMKEMLNKIMVDQTRFAPRQVNAVGTRSGLQLEELTPKKRNGESASKESERNESEIVAQEERVQPIVKLPPLFPQKFKKQKEDECFGKFLSLLKQVHINLLLVDVLQGIPRYAKYVKEIVANKRRLTEYETVALIEECNSRIKIIQITIGQSIHARGLSNLGASINLMPTLLYKKLGLGSPKPTTIILQLADQCVARPEGVLEDVLVQVGSLIFLVDYVVLNSKPDPEALFILGRPFLATWHAMIVVAADQLTMRSHDEVEVFDVYKALKLPAVYEELSAIVVIDLEAEAHYIASKDLLECVLVRHDIYEDAEV
ncbi:hypothetical protein R3W88_029709 [Solanum pinnatisectum]|uniref:Reverse transcriptase domain-containing protein n=1 Tax=Solanum pinnatisectum TaxID=50273 RepID=A0AAV9K880_9SOLN|nr:hypothetical protein R3W88_029709 [Solanum pinnatisectum]